MHAPAECCCHQPVPAVRQKKSVYGCNGPKMECCESRQWWNHHLQPTNCLSSKAKSFAYIPFSRFNASRLTNTFFVVNDADESCKTVSMCAGVMIWRTDSSLHIPVYQFCFTQKATQCKHVNKRVLLEVLETQLLFF